MDIVAAPDEMFTMAPAFDSRSAGKSALVSRIAANRLSAKLAWHSSSGMDAVPCGNPPAPPALFTRMSRPPRASSAPAAMAFTPEAEATSPATTAAPAGKASPRERAVTTTFASASSRRCAIAAPMPRVPPVTSARRPTSSLEKSSLLDMRFLSTKNDCVLFAASDPHEQCDAVRKSCEIVRAAWRHGFGLVMLLLDGCSERGSRPGSSAANLLGFHGRARTLGPGLPGKAELRPLPLHGARQCV